MAHKQNVGCVWSRITNIPFILGELPSRLDLVDCLFVYRAAGNFFLRRVRLLLLVSLSVFSMILRFYLSSPFLLAILVVVLFVVAARSVDASKNVYQEVKPTCPTGVRVRREWRTLSKAEQQHFLDMVLLLQKRPTPDTLSEYDKLVKVHGDGAGPIHGYPCFLVWHRFFVVQFEQKLADLSHPTPLAVPYWKFELDSKAPETSPVWADDAFGGNGSPTITQNILNWGSDGSSYLFNCVTTGRFKDYQPMRDPTKRHCLGRSWSGDNPDTIGSFVSVEAVNKILIESLDYESFRNNWELDPHGTVHNNIGGEMLVCFFTMSSLFHAVVDHVQSCRSYLLDFPC